jgi:CTP:phosphocholine cytidylyltransferase-like protein
MQIIILAAGAGKRFVDNGIFIPKPLIKVKKKLYFNMLMSLSSYKEITYLFVKNSMKKNLKFLKKYIPFVRMQK